MDEVGEARFLTELETRRGNNGKWILTSDLVFYSAILRQQIIAKAGMESDYASVPRLPFAYLLFGGIAEEAAVIHDHLYTNNVSGITRKVADSIFEEAAASLKVAAWRRKPMWLAVRLFGGRHWGTGSPLATSTVTPP